MTTPYTTGSITLTNGSAVVTGVGTAWQTALIVGGIVVPDADGNALPISSVDTNTQITTAVKWRGASGTYAYAIMRDTAYGQQLVANANALATYIQRLDNASLSALASLAASMSADKFAYATGLNTMAWAALSTFNREMLALGDAAAVRNKIGAFSTSGGGVAGSLTVTGGHITCTSGSMVSQYFAATSAANVDAFVLFQTNQVNRWGLYKNNAGGEPGGNKGSDLAIARYTDAGNYAGQSLVIQRASGAVSFPETPHGSASPGSGVVTLGTGSHLGFLPDSGGFIFGRPGLYAGGNPGAGGRVMHVGAQGWYKVIAQVTANGQGTALSIAKNGMAGYSLYVPEVHWGSYACVGYFYMNATEYFSLMSLAGPTQISLENTRFTVEYLQP